jgi:hypothetical protein
LLTLQIGFQLVANTHHCLSKEISCAILFLLKNGQLSFEKVHVKKIYNVDTAAIVEVKKPLKKWNPKACEEKMIKTTVILKMSSEYFVVDHSCTKNMTLKIIATKLRALANCHMP